MALTDCKDCKQKISKSAKTCPNCGAKTSAAKRSTTIAGLFVLMFIGVPVILVISIIASANKEDDAEVTRIKITPAQIQKLERVISNSYDLDSISNTNELAKHKKMLLSRSIELVESRQCDIDNGSDLVEFGWNRSERNNRIYFSYCNPSGRGGFTVKDRIYVNIDSGNIFRTDF